MSSTVLYWYDDGFPFLTHEIRFGAVTSETHEDVVTITEHPVESGSSNSDHAKDEPPRVSIEGIVSTVLTVGDVGTIPVPQVAQATMQMRGPDRPSREAIPQPPMDRSIVGVVGAGIGALTGGNSVIVRVPTYLKIVRPIPVQTVQRLIPGDKPREIYESLLEAKTKKALFTIATRFREHFDMMLERVTLLRTAEDGTSGRFQLDFKRIVITETETVSVPIPAEARGAVLRNKGAQAAKPAATPDPSQVKSTLFKEGESLGIF